MRLLFLALFATAAHAGTCDHLEFAELDAMDKQELLAMRCQYFDDWLTYLGAGDVRTNRRCSDEFERMDRVLGRKLALPPDPKERGSAITHLCAELKRGKQP